jgi:hypothetical protein
MILGIYSTIVGDVNASDVEGNLLWKTSDEMVQNYINDTAFMTSIRKAITDGLCDLDITQVFGKISSTLSSVGGSFLDALGLDFGSAFGAKPSPAQ